MMSRKEEKLIQMAFGELPEPQAAALDETLQQDVKAADTLAAFRQMKNDLRVLSNAMPEAQIGIERIRDAILKEGLKETSPAPRWSWKWMPAFGLATAMVLVVALNFRD